MNYKNQQQALAYWCGWKWGLNPWALRWLWGKYYTQHPDGVRLCGFLPDYTKLDALHEVEEQLDDQQQKRYLLYLLGDHLGTLHPQMWKLTHTTAKHKREALVKALGLWKD